MVRILGDTVDRADLDTLGLVIVADALGAEIGIDLIDLVTLVDGTIGALGLTYITVDAFVSNNQSHFSTPAKK